jgi:transcriptional regulator with XRE-family HTH domain
LQQEIVDLTLRRIRATMVAMETPTLVQALVAIQRANGWTDGDMAKRLGVPRQHWNYIRRGQRGLGVQTLGRIASAFPELRDAARFFVAPDSPRVAEIPLAGAS